MSVGITRRSLLALIGGLAARHTARAIDPSAEEVWLREATAAALTAGKWLMIIHVPVAVGEDVDGDGWADVLHTPGYVNRMRTWGAAFGAEDPKLAGRLPSLEVVCSTLDSARGVFPRLQRPRSWGWFVDPRDPARSRSFGVGLAERDPCTSALARPALPAPNPQEGSSPEELQSFFTAYEADRRRRMRAFATPLLNAMERAAQAFGLPEADADQGLLTAKTLVRGAVLGPETGWLACTDFLRLTFCHPIRVNPRK